MNFNLRFRPLKPDSSRILNVANQRRTDSLGQLSARLSASTFSVCFSILHKSAIGWHDRYAHTKPGVYRFAATLCFTTVSLYSETCQ
jgi:hypothetical protein